MSEILTKSLLLFIGLCIGFILFRNRESTKNIISSGVFNWLLPYVIFMEVASMELITYWWSYSLIGVAFVLIPFFVGWYIFRLTKHESILVATAEGGTMGFAIYATIGSEPLVRFFLVDMIGNGLSLFLIIFPILAQGKLEKNKTFIRLVIAMIAGMCVNFAGVHPLQKLAFLATIEPILISTLVLLIAIIIGSGVVIRTSIEILKSKLFIGFWIFRLLLLAISLYSQFPLAVTILAILPPSFMLPIFHGMQKDLQEAEYATNFIASCIPITIILATGLIIFV